MWNSLQIRVDHRPGIRLAVFFDLDLDHRRSVRADRLLQLLLKPLGSVGAASAHAEGLGQRREIRRIEVGARRAAPGTA